MFRDQVVPFLQKVMPSGSGYVCRVLRTVGVGESRVQEQIEGKLADLISHGLEIGYCARTGEVDVRLATRDSAGSAIVDQAVVRVHEIIGPAVFAEGEVSLERAVVEMLIRNGATVSTAESCTGGFLANRLTNVPGASDVFLGGAVTYSNKEKIRQLGVSSDDLETHGAVSETVARQMAEGIRLVTGSDYGLSTTGIAGPSGGTDEKPVGLVFMAVAGPDSTTVFHRINTFDRETFKFVTTQQILDCLRLMVIDSASG
jgi:nicotinamide-nucleotide amidase